MFRSQSDNKQREILDFVLRMAYMAEIKEWDNRFHLERIRRYCFSIGSGLDLPQRENEIISIASQLHDIGKVTMPEELLNRKGNYEASEWEIIEKHTLEGTKILKGSSSPVLQTAEMIAYTHHERWDGSGYPEGIKGDKIPLSSRICSLADVFDALTTKRTYKAHISDMDALKLIQDSSGVMFDPRLVKAFTVRFNEILKTKNTIADV
jgi:putative two-component system response regulator